MKSRFPKVWCASCGSMQFAGACSHGRMVDLRAGKDAQLAKLPTGDLIRDALRMTVRDWRGAAARSPNKPNVSFDVLNDRPVLLR